MFEALILGVVQGLTEFLPVSSSGHLILARDFLGFDLQGSLAFDALLHLATALAVLVYFRKDIVRIARSLFNSEAKERVLLWALVLGTIPAALLGFIFEGAIETTFRSTALVASALVGGSLLFVIAERFGPKPLITAEGRMPTITVKKGLWVGVFQALALIPGISRSGASISGGLLFGLSREEATRFAFLLSFPILFGAGLKKLFDVFGGSATLLLGPTLFGSVVAFVVGILAIHLMLRFVKTHTLYPFVVYRLALALLVFLA